MDDFFAVLINRESDSDVSDADNSGGVQDLWETDSNSSSDLERDDHDETSSSDGITDTECIATMHWDNDDDDVPLYEGAKVSRLGALIVVVLFSLRHQLSGQALTDLVRVIRSLLPDGHSFVASAYLL